MLALLLTLTLAAPATLHGFTVTDIHGEPYDAKALAGKTVLIVNTASQCGFTPQYAGLERLYRTYKDKGLVVLAFPSNDFGGQEPGDRKQIHGFVNDTFETTFPLMDKVAVEPGDTQHPVFAWLTTQGPEATRGKVQWNFTKFLVGPDGKVTARFAPKVDPMAPEVTAAVEKALAPAAKK